MVKKKTMAKKKGPLATDPPPPTITTPFESPLRGEVDGDPSTGKEAAGWLLASCGLNPLPPPSSPGVGVPMRFRNRGS